MAYVPVVFDDEPRPRLRHCMTHGMGKHHAPLPLDHLYSYVQNDTRNQNSPVMFGGSVAVLFCGPVRGVRSETAGPVRWEWDAGTHTITCISNQRLELSLQMRPPCENETCVHSGRSEGHSLKGRVICWFGVVSDVTAM